MKLDAEFLKKNVFWVLLIVVLPLVVIALVLVGPTLGSIIAQTEKKMEDEYKGLQAKNKDVKTKGDVDSAMKRTELFKGQETKVWKDAYETQKAFMTWPTEFEESFRFQDGNFAKSIDAERPGPATPANLTPEPPPDPDKYGLRTLTGIVLNTDENWIDVKVDKIKDAKDDKGAKAQADTPGEPVRVYTTKKIKVKLTEGGNAKDIFFPALKSGDRVKVTYEVGKYFGDGLTYNELELYKKTYHSQVAPILKQVDPINTKGDGVVMLGDWMFSEKELPRATDKFLTFLPGDWIADPENHKEMWTAQEDLWIQRELYRMIAQANDYVAGFEKQATGNLTNPYWDLSFKLDKTNRQLTLIMTNGLPHTQSANVMFKIPVTVAEKDGDGKDVQKKVQFEFAVQAGSLPAKKSRTFTKTLPENLVAAHLDDVRQVLTWENAGVERIDQVSIGSGKGPLGSAPGGFAHSNRTFIKELLSFPRFKKASAAAPVEPPKGLPGEAAGAKDEFLSKNGFDYKRYNEITPQARRVPVAVVMIVDQNHLSRVLTSFSNSHLRFLTTQVLFNRYPKSISPLKPVAKQPGTGYGPSGGFPGPSFGGSPYGPYPGGTMPKYGSAPDPTGASTGGESSSAEFLEVVIYGIVSLYERFPARPASTEDEAG